VQCSKEGYEREESEASASAPVRITLRKRTP